MGNPEQPSVGAPAAPFAQQVELVPGPQGVGIALQRALQAAVLIVVDHVAGVDAQTVFEELVDVHDGAVVADPEGFERVAGGSSRADRETAHGVGLRRDDRVVGGAVEVDVFAAGVELGQQVVALFHETADHRGIFQQVFVRIVAVGQRFEEVGAACERQDGGQRDYQFFHVLAG